MHAAGYGAVAFVEAVYILVRLYPARAQHYFVEVVALVVYRFQRGVGDVHVVVAPVVGAYAHHAEYSPASRDVFAHGVFARAEQVVGVVFGDYDCLAPLPHVHFVNEASGEHVVGGRVHFLVRG